ncbi:Protein of unknown function [Cotesia congregata]|uniref:Uncharacterized protein n=1 Tax=Cotesia congregata TaxID=51543 RepID=A0A8J2HFI6_COTCN|nr:Protein of unknown function [Cotesia congregata]
MLINSGASLKSKLGSSPSKHTNDNFLPRLNISTEPRLRISIVPRLKISIVPRLKIINQDLSLEYWLDLGSRLANQDLLDRYWVDLGSKLINQDFGKETYTTGHKRHFYPIALSRNF